MLVGKDRNEELTMLLLTGLVLAEDTVGQLLRHLRDRQLCNLSLTNVDLPVLFHAKYLVPVPIDVAIH